MAVSSTGHAGPTPVVLHGIDVSVWQGTIDWKQVAMAGISFAMIKRSEGTNVADPQFGTSWARAKLAGIPVLGAYHFAHPELNDPHAEARYFLSLLPPLEAGDLVALDIELGRTQDRSSWALAWLGAVQAQLGFPPLVYADEDYITHWLGDPALAAYPLWLAAYSPSIPSSIGPWQQGAALWQYTEALQVPGINGNVDGDQLARDLGGLKALGKPATAPTTRIAVILACALKPSPDHTSPALANIPAGGPGIDLGRRTTTAGELWANIQWRDQYGWVLASNLRPA